MRFALVTLTLVALLLAGALWGGVWIWAALLYVTLLTYLVDRLSPLVVQNADPEKEFPAEERLSVLLGLAHFIVLPLGIWALAQPGMTGVERVGLFLALGLFAGQIGHPNAHELIHKAGRWHRRLGKAIYSSVLIGHHASAHPLVHHVYVASDKDPASARHGQGFWRYLPGASIGSFRAGLAAETRRHRAKPIWHHPYVHYTLGALAMLGLGWLLAGGLGMALVLGLGIHAQMQIFLSDYVQHYGLRRKMLENGKLEPVGPQHSWNAPHRMSAALMLNAPRHSDHHMTPQRSYPALQLDVEEMPVLPYSLPMMGAIALVPPLWHRLMGPRAARWSAER